MSTDRDQARLIAERVARKVAGGDAHSSRQSRSTTPRNGAPVRQELSAIRDGLHDLESKLERIESRIVNSPDQPVEFRRARVIDFISPGPPVKVAPQTSISNDFTALETTDVVEDRDFTPPTQSPWLASWSSMFGQTPSRAEVASPQSGISNPQVSSHPSQERFEVDEAALNELVEFFENEKKCSADPSGKPCDHCAMCSSRGF